MRICITFFYLSFLSACAVEKSPPQSAQPPDTTPVKEARDASLSPQQTGQNLSLVREPVDAKSLRVLNLAAGLGRRGEQQGLNPIVGFISYSVDARADSIKYRACVDPSPNAKNSGSVSEQDGCSSGQTQFTEFILPVFVEGKVEVQVQACVDPVRAQTSDLCGPIAITSFQQPKNVDVVLQPLLEERQRYLLDLEDISVEVENLLREYEKNIHICEASGSVNPQFKKLIADYLKMGSSLIRMSSAYYGSPSIRPLLGPHAGEEEENATTSLQLTANQSIKGIANQLRSTGLSQKAIRQDKEKFQEFFAQFGQIQSLQLVPYQHSSFVRGMDNMSSIVGLVFSVEQVLIVAASIDILLTRSDEDIYGTYHGINNPYGSPDNKPTCPVREKVVHQLGLLFGEPNASGSCYSQGVPFKPESSFGRSFRSCGLVMKTREKLETVEEKIRKRCPTCLTQSL